MIHIGRDVVIKRNVFNEKQCKSLIAICDDERSLKIVNDRLNPDNMYNLETSFTDVKLLLKNAPNLQSFIKGHIHDAVNGYCKFRGLPSLGTRFDNPELMKFEAGKDQFASHFDGNGKDCTRTLAIIWYLNDVNEGGELHLPSNTEALVINPEQGKMVIVPTDWTHYHYVSTPISNDRYSLITFIRYSGDNNE